jgi:hypothetical protein
MNHISEPCHPASRPSFTEKQGQYLAFIHAYTLVLGRPRPRLICNDTSPSPRPRCTLWCSRSSTQV